MSLRDGVHGEFESVGMSRWHSSEKQIPHPLSRVRDDISYFLLTKILEHPLLSTEDFQVLAVPS
jgi:hypothetical protein